MTRARWLGIGLAVSWVVLIGLQLRTGQTGVVDLSTALRGVTAWLGWTEPLEGSVQSVVELRWWRALAAGLVGGSLALAGALLQGLFRNGLAAPSVLGVSAGATLGAAVAILALGGYAPSALSQLTATPYLMTAFAFVGSLGTGFLVMTLATVGGRVSVPTLLLTGIAINASIGGVLAAIQSAFLEDWGVQRAMMAWTFGTLDDRKGFHVAMALCGLTLACAVIPFVATELDLFAGGEDDAHALGVHVARTKILALGAAAMATACAIAVAGQIAFVGLVVPHLVRLLSGSSHRSLLGLSVLAGAVFLLGTDLAQRVWLGDQRLQPGVMMSLLGGPFFLFLLIRQRRGLRAW